MLPPQKKYNFNSLETKFAYMKIIKNISSVNFLISTTKRIQHNFNYFKTDPKSL